MTGPAVSWTKVYQLGSEQENSIRYSPVMCMHCDAAPCIDARCSSKAISLRADGIVVIDQTKRMEIGACFAACPYGAIETNPEKTYFPTPQPFEQYLEAYRQKRPGKASKCSLCKREGLMRGKFRAASRSASPMHWSSAILTIHTALSARSRSGQRAHGEQAAETKNLLPWLGS